MVSGSRSSASIRRHRRRPPRSLNRPNQRLPLLRHNLLLHLQQLPQHSPLLRLNLLKLLNQQLPLLRLLRHSPLPRPLLQHSPLLNLLKLPSQRQLPLLLHNLPQNPPRKRHRMECETMRNPMQAPGVARSMGRRPTTDHSARKGATIHPKGDTIIIANC